MNRIQTAEQAAKTLKKVLNDLQHGDVDKNDANDLMGYWKAQPGQVLGPLTLPHD